ncbi:glucanase b [Niveomyces insectorum RCEF 264]|uniref:Glucanase b n=1 Tax=Niveomyces insectorum RCEF 264 TaxID=1081102 RepID=A0A167WWW1_9HYPO|nr:glucanase b [Niveomyces insectorum RCEF 264]
MATLDDCLRLQRQTNILTAPTAHTPDAEAAHGPSAVASTAVAAAPAGAAPASTPATLKIALQNNTSAANLYVSITGLDINNNNAVWLLQSDGASPYYPANPSSNGQALQANVAIAVGPPGSTRTVTIPQLAGARIWFVQDTPLTFLLNVGGGGGPGLVEPSVTNPSDPNYALRWDFCEFTYNTSQLFANVSYVDFLSIPVALRLESSDGSPAQTVAGLPATALATVCTALQKQQQVDCAGWDQLVVQVKSASSSSSSAAASFLRALSPNTGRVFNGALFQNYFEPYVAQVWAHYRTASLTVDTQNSWGSVTGQVDAATNALTFPGVGAFPPPSTADVFSCSTGAFAAYPANTDEMGNLTARLAAALNRSTLLTYATQPSAAAVAAYYQAPVTNHYARILHATSLDGRGYAFPYDDVVPTNGADQAGTVASGSPALLTVYIGGGAGAGTKGPAANTTTRSTPVNLRDMARPGRQLISGRRHHQHHRRSELPPPPQPQLQPQPPYSSSLSSSLPPTEAKQALLAAVQQNMAPFLGPAARETADAHQEKQHTRRALSDSEKIDLEQGLYAVDAQDDSDAVYPSKLDTNQTAWVPAASAPSLAFARFACLLQRLLLGLWMALGCLGRTCWAAVPRSVAVPLGAAGARVAANPAVAAWVEGLPNALG